MKQFVILMLVCFGLVASPVMAQAQKIGYVDLQKALNLSADGKEAKEKMLPRVKVHARDLGVDVAKVRIVDNRYRWGSCTLKDNVNFNWRLIKSPMFVIDYVIIHELAHLIEPSHAPRSGAR